MAETEAPAPAEPTPRERPPLNTAGFFEDKGGATPLLGFSNLMGFHLPPARTSKDVLAERQAAGERVATSYETAAREGEQNAAELRRVSQQQQDERRQARPPTPTLPQAPSQNPRLFLQPGDSILGQFQTIMLGLGNMVLQGKGLSGSAMTATAAMKGLLEGWQAGDSERVKREYDTWKTESDRILAQHKLARESWEDLLTDHKQSWDAILAQTRVRAEINGNKALAEAARVGNIDAVLKWYADTEHLEIEHEKFRAQMAHWHALAAQAERNYLATEGHRRETEARAKEAAARGDKRIKLSEQAGVRADDRLKLAKATNANVLKLQQADLSFTQQIQNVGVVRDAVELLAKEGLLADGNTFWDKATVALKMQTMTGRQDIANAVNVLTRLGIPLVTKTEISLGMQGQQMRIKSIAEAEIGNIMGAPKLFWDQFLPRAEKSFRDQQQLTRSHLMDLRALGALPGMTPEPQPHPGFEILSTDDEEAGSAAAPLAP